MKKKPILTIVMALAVLIACFAFTRDTNLPDPEKRAIISFLNSFNKQLKAGDIDSAASYFDAKGIRNGIELVYSVTGKYRGPVKNAMLSFDATLNTQSARVNFINPQLATATVIVSFSKPGVKTQTSSVIFTIQKKADERYKINDADIKQFVKNYNYFDFISRNEKASETYIYNPASPAAFEAVRVSNAVPNEKDRIKSLYDRLIYTVKKDYLGGRGQLYPVKNNSSASKGGQNIFIIQRSSPVNKYSTLTLPNICNQNGFRALNDSVFEYKTAVIFSVPLTDKNLNLLEGTYYHFFQIRGGSIASLKTRRLFPTQYIKLDDSYLQGCFAISEDEPGNPQKISTVDMYNADILAYMKNEIYASYHYHFKEQKWNSVFFPMFDNSFVDIPINDNVQDSLTTIDKYNIDFIESKLKMLASNKLATK